ncbi:MAG: pseudaminic acid cytidylyltransferase [Peptostreptococcaceae bacterium]|nr:pseudaminic acid cytidylyltransferase [Peptostreptococcaceae bacterium]
MKKIAIITARGGSKRIPRKNIKEFCGQPIIKYSIDAALNSCLFDEVMVSTDDEEIAEIAKKFGAKVPFMRSSVTSNDYATTADVINEVLDEYEKRDLMFDYFCCIYPTAPFVTRDKLVNTFNLLVDKAGDSLIPVVKYSFPPQRCIVIDNEYAKMKWPENMNIRSQDFEPIYHDCGQFYWMKSEAIKKYRMLLTCHTIPFVISEMEVQDIDNDEDWLLAELKYKMLLRK